MVKKLRWRYLMNQYYIGGSPCSGKSTIAEIAAEKYGLFYFKVDDFLEKYIIWVQKRNIRYARSNYE